MRRIAGLLGAAALVLVLVLVLAAPPQPARALTLTESPSLAGEGLPPVEDRLPDVPAVVDLARPGLTKGHHGGTLRMLIQKAKDIRYMVVYGYARLVGYDRDFNLRPDILEAVDIDEGRRFTFHLRPGHRWSDGRPFTSEDFRYYWEDIANNPDMSPSGIPSLLKVNGQPPLFEVLAPYTVRYTWAQPNPYFLPALARAAPFYIYRPAHYLKQFHKRYIPPENLAQTVKKRRARNWEQMHTRKGRQYHNNNPALPTLQPWMLITNPPADRFTFERNPYYHRIDAEGRQLPYIDRVHLTVVSGKLIPARSGAGGTDLQASGLSFGNYTLLKKSEDRSGYNVRLWRSAKGAQVALYPNLNAVDPVWRKLFRNIDFRRALSLAINRQEINQVIYYGLADAANNTVLPQSRLYKKDYATRWANFDLNKANAMLDALGLTKRDDLGIRLLPDGRPMKIIVETAGEQTNETDVLELIRDSWLAAGIKIYAKPLQREVLRNRVFAGKTLISIWFGLENGVPSADSSPEELAPTNQNQLQWPHWGQYVETNGMAGEPIDMPVALELQRLSNDWGRATDVGARRAAWQSMLAIHADNVFSWGVVSGVPQPVVVSARLRNVPEEALYNWDPGAQFGVHRMDAFWLDGEREDK